MTANTFVGKHVTEVRDLLVTTAVSGGVTLLMGPPGCGKTAMSLAAAEAMFGKDAMSFIRFNPTTSPARIEGVVDYARLMNDPPQWYLIKDGTPYDPACRVFVADEVAGRANDAIYDILLDVLDRQDIDPENTPVTFGTGNFLPKGERTEALLDRCWSVYWFGDGVDVKEVARAKMGAAHGKLSLPGPMPNKQEIWDIRNATPGPKAIEAVCNAVAEMADACMQGLKTDTPQGVKVRSFGKPNNRRITIWSNILLRRSILDTGSNDFTDVSKIAKAMLAYAWVSRTPAEAADWKALVMSLADPVGAAIETMMVACFDAMTKAAADLINQGKRHNAAISLGMIMQSSLQNLEKIVPASDKRFVDAQDIVTTQLGEFIGGKRDTFGDNTEAA